MMIMLRSVVFDKKKEPSEQFQWIIVEQFHKLIGYFLV